MLLWLSNLNQIKVKPPSANCYLTKVFIAIQLNERVYYSHPLHWECIDCRPLIIDFLATLSVFIRYCKPVWIEVIN